MKKILTLALITLMFGVVASAASITFVDQTVSYNPVTGTGVLLSVTSNLGAGITQFNPAWGTLGSVSISIAGYIKDVWTLQNLDPINTNTFTFGWSAGSPDIIISGVGGYNQGSIGFTNIYPTVQVVAAGATVNTTAQIITSGSGPTAGNLATFTGVGAMASNFWTVTPTNNGQCSATNDWLCGAVSRYGVQVSVTYNYEPPPPSEVPEPATFAMLGGALIGLGVLARRRK